MAQTKEFVDASHALNELSHAIALLESKNAKLRELVRHMGACIQYLDRSDEDGGCVLCPYQSVEHDCEFESRMLELGIEVDYDKD